MISNKNVLRKYRYVPPGLVRQLFPSFVWKSKKEAILLTFDDGPAEGNTDIILKKLNEHKIKALFFVVGDNVKKYGNMLNEIHSEGHIIGNHTMTHKTITDSDFNQSYQVRETSRMISDITGDKVKYFRPPHGKFNWASPYMISRHELKCVMWNLLTWDFTNDLSLAKKSMNYLKSNSIIVLHDNIKCKEIITQAIDLVVETAQQNNFSIGTPDECLP
jgi:peptidoglycan/xylan/chitin deacetylase (PgdA/CDA1 family)